MDVSIFKRAKAKDTRAFEELILPYEKLVYNICYRMTGNIDDARDVSQEVWLKVYKNLNKCAGFEMFGAWTRVITNNACLDFLRRKKSRIKPESIDEVLQTGDNGIKTEIEDKNAEDPLKAVIANERREAVTKAINALKPAYKTMIVYRDIQGFTYEEIASATGLNLGTVKSQISRARNTLREIISKKMEQGEI